MEHQYVDGNFFRNMPYQNIIVMIKQVLKQDDGIENFCGNNSKKVTGTQQDPCFLIKKTQRNIATNIAHEHAAAYRSWK